MLLLEMWVCWGDAGVRCLSADGGSCHTTWRKEAVGWGGREMGLDTCTVCRGDKWLQNGEKDTKPAHHFRRDDTEIDWESGLELELETLG